MSNNQIATLQWQNNQPFVNANGTLTQLAQQVFTSLLQAVDLGPDTLDAPDFLQPQPAPQEPLPPITQQLSGSPTSFSALRRGAFTVAGGTVTSVAFKRLNNTETFLAFQGKIEVLPGDSITVTYSSAPTVRFYPT